MFFHTKTEFSLLKRKQFGIYPQTILHYKRSLPKFGRESLRGEHNRKPKIHSHFDDGILSILHDVRYIEASV
ncbi:hypothetical protein ABKN59_003772 [Abortiporus biennis]